MITFSALTFLALATSSFESSQKELTLEGNRLLHTEAIHVTGTCEGLVNAFRAAGLDVSVYKELDSSTRAVEPGTGATYPVYSGRAVEVGEQGVALAGSSVPVVSSRDREFVSTRGREYPVVGRLGRHRESLVEGEALIFDHSLFSESPEPLVLDGPDVAEHYAALFPGAPYEVLDSSTDRRTNVDHISPIILTLSWAMLVGTTVAIGLLSASFARRPSRVGLLVGLPRSKVLARPVLELIGSALAGVGFGTVAWLVTFSPEPPARVAALLPLIGLAALVHLASLSRLRTRR